MASLEIQKGRYRIVLRYCGVKYQRALDTEVENDAIQSQKRVEENLQLLKRGRLSFPGGDLITFLLSDGKINEAPVIEKALTLGEYFERYRKSPPPGKEPITTYTESIHIDHLIRLIGAKTPVVSIDSKKLQEYVTARSQENGRGTDHVSHVTIKKEIGTFSSVWNSWGKTQNLVTVIAPTKGLKYPKQKVKAPFQTWKEIKRKIDKGASPDLWDALFLTPAEIEELLVFAKQGIHPFVYAMTVFAAHTGARRSEMMRSLKEDIDFDSGMATIREKKKDSSKTVTYRHVPMSPLLKRVMKEHFKNHPGKLTFSAEPDLPLTPQLANHHIRWLLDGSKWEVIKGWHVLRHSFITACVMKGIDQRMIDLWVGHTTEAMRKRYTHLIPSTAKTALASVFS